MKMAAFPANFDFQGGSIAENEFRDLYYKSSCFYQNLSNFAKNLRKSTRLAWLYYIDMFYFLGK